MFTTNACSSGAITISVVATLFGVFTIFILAEKGDKIHFDLVTKMNEFNNLTERAWVYLMNAKFSAGTQIRSERQAWRCHCQDEGGECNCIYNKNSWK
jgi:hypothetical protein